MVQRVGIRVHLSESQCKYVRRVVCSRKRGKNIFPKQLAWWKKAMAYLSLSSWWEKIDLLFFCCFLSTCLFFLCCVFLHSGMGSAYLPMSLLFILIFPLKSSPMEFYTFFSYCLLLDLIIRRSALGSGSHRAGVSLQNSQSRTAGTLRGCTTVLGFGCCTVFSGVCLVCASSSLGRPEDGPSS